MKILKTKEDIDEEISGLENEIEGMLEYGFGWSVALLENRIKELKRMRKKIAKRVGVNP